MSKALFISRILFAALFLTVVPRAIAQDEEEVAADKPVKTPDLHKIYVPYEKLDEVFGTDKERVMVPYKEFLELWKLKYGPKPGGNEAPMPFTVESARYEGRVDAGIAYFEAELAIEVFNDRWHRIPLAFSGVAFEEVLVDDKPGVLVPTKSGYQLILRGKGIHTVRAKFVAGVARAKDLASTKFGLPAVPLHRLQFRVPGKDTKVTITPARAHSTRTDGDETVLLAFLGAQGAVHISWRSKPEETDVEPSMIFSTDLIDLNVEERVLRGSAQFDLEVLRTPLAKTEFSIPAGLQVLEVTGKNIRTWGFADEARRRLQVTFHKPVLGRASVKIGFEGPAKVPGDFDAPVFRVKDAARERGWLRVQGAEGVGVRPAQSENIFQTDLNGLPAPIRGGRGATGFRFPALPYALTIRTERIQPRVTLLARARVEVERRQVKMHTDFHFTIERAGIFTLVFDVPDNITLTDVGTDKLVDSWRETRVDGKRVLTVELRGRRQGAFTIPIRAVRTLDLAAGALPIPLLRVRSLDREEGTLSVFMDPGIEASATTENIVPVEIAKIAKEAPYKSPLPLRFGYRWRSHEPSVQFKVEARKPKVTCIVRSSLRAEENKVRLATELGYRIEYTGVERVRFRIPQRIAENLKLEESYEIKKEDDPAKDGEEPTATWTVELGSPVLGDLRLKLRYDEKFNALKVNEKRSVPVPAIVPLDTQTTTTFVAVRKAPVLKIDAPTTAYEQIDASELPAILRTEDVFLALRRFDAPAKFPLSLEKHAYQPVADLVVRHAHLKTVLSEEGEATTTAYFEILNNDRQFLALRLPEGAKVLELWVANEVKKPRIGEGGVILAELKTGLAKDAAFRVAVVYTHPVDRDGGLAMSGPELPAYEDKAAPFQALLTWSVVFPGDWKITGYGGNVVPVRKGTTKHSWVYRAIDAIGGLIRPSTAPRDPQAAKARSLPRYDDIVPVHKERGSREVLFANGMGDGELEIFYRSPGSQTMAILFASVIGFFGVFGLARRVKPLLAGGSFAFGALFLLAFTSYAWIAVLNGVLVGAAIATIIVWVAERRKGKA